MTNEIKISELEIAIQQKSEKLPEMLNAIMHSEKVWMLELQTINDVDLLLHYYHTVVRLGAVLSTAWTNLSHRKIKIELDGKTRKELEQIEKDRASAKRVKGAKLSQDAKRIKIFIQPGLKMLSAPEITKFILSVPGFTDLTAERIQAAIEEIGALRAKKGKK